MLAKLLWIVKHQTAVSSLERTLCFEIRNLCSFSHFLIAFERITYDLINFSNTDAFIRTTYLPAVWLLFCRYCYWKMHKSINKVAFQKAAPLLLLTELTRMVASPFVLTLVHVQKRKQHKIRKAIFLIIVI